MKYLKKIGVILLAISLTVNIAGCKDDGKKNAANSEKPVLTWYLPGEKQTDIQAVLDEANKIIVPVIGAKLDLQFIDTGSFQDKMTMLIASEKDFDLCFTADWTNTFIANAKKGAFLGLTDLINNSAPNLKNVLPPYLWSAATIKNEIYAVPNLQVLAEQRAISVLKKYADKYNLDTTKIKTVEDIEPFLDIIKKNEPNIYPYRNNSGTYDFISQVYEEIAPSTGIGIRKDGKDLKLVELIKTVENKHGLQVVRKWFEKGYIRPDTASLMNDDVDVNAGKYAVWIERWKPGVEAEQEVKLGQKSVLIPFGAPYLSANAGMSTMTAISRTSKNPKLAIKLLELTNTNKELYNLLCFGIEGKHYSKVNDKQIEVIQKSGYTPNSAWKFGNQFNAFYLQNQEVGIWDQTEKMNDEAMKSPISGFMLDTDSIKNELSQISAVNQEFGVISSGSVPIEDTYDKYVAKLETIGLENVLNAAQSQVDAFLKSK